MIYAGKVVDFNFSLTYNLIIECDICRAFVPRVLSERDMTKTGTSKERGVLGLLAGCVGEYKLASVLTSVFVVFEVVLEVLIPIIMSQIIDVGLAEGLSEYTFHLQLGASDTEVFTVDSSVKFIVICGAMMVVMALMSLTFGVLSGRYAAYAATGFGANVRQKIYYKVQDFSFANLDRFNTAGLVTRLTTDITNVQMSYMMVIRVLVRAPVMLALALGMAISINADLAVVFAVALPVIVLGLIIGIIVVFPRFTKMLKKYDDMNEITQENLTAIRTVKTFVREDHETEKFMKISSLVQKLQFSAEKMLVIAMPLMQVVAFGCIIAVVWFGGNNIIAGSMHYGSFAAFLNYIMQILMSLGMVAMVFVMLVLSRASAGRIAEVFREVPDIADNPCPKALEVADGSVDFDNVDFSYSKTGDVLNLEGVDLHVKPGEVVGVIGGTGSAKSTLVQLIPRLYDVRSGSVKVGGVDVRDYKLDTLRDAVAMVLQKNVLFSGTIKDNLKWGNPDATDEQIEHAARAAQAHDFVMSFPDGYDTELGQGGVNVSGGQKQRLCIARALLKHPKVMILDDSTSAVDTATDAAIRKGLKEEFGSTTVFIIAQRIGSVQDADKIVVMDDGRIDAIGTHEELLASNKIYQDVYYSQQRGSDEAAAIYAEEDGASGAAPEDGGEEVVK